MGWGSKLKKVAKAVVSAPAKAIQKSTNVLTNTTTNVLDAVGLESVSNVVNKANDVGNKALDVVSTASKRSVDVAFNPITATKNVVRNPLDAFMYYTGLDSLYKTNGGNKLSSAATEVAQKNTGAEDITSQERSRMLSRQGMQGANPILLLGQDFNADSVALDKDRELGGERR